MTTNATCALSTAIRSGHEAHPGSKAAKVWVLLFAGLSTAMIVAFKVDAETQIQEFGLLCIYMFLLSVYAAPQSRMSTFQLTTSAIYSRIKAGELKVGYLERACSLLTIAFGIAAFIGVYKTYLR